MTVTDAATSAPELPARDIPARDIPARDIPAPSTPTLSARAKPGPRVASRVAANWQDLPYTRFDIQPLTPTIGAEIAGLSMADAVDADTFSELNRALLEWKVLFFRDQHITHLEHAAFALNWGALESHPFARVHGNQPEEQEVLLLEKGPDAPGRENIWHSDVTWRLNPSLGSILRAIDLPPVGGDTLWADMSAAYECLSDEIKDQIDGLVAVHDWITTFGRGMDPATRDRLRPDFPAVEHPVVRTHPETGRKMLYVNEAFTQHIVGLADSESRELLQYLYRQATFPEYQCRFRWAPGDVAFWDNRSTQHYASSDYHPQRRVMERITIVGDRPR